MEKRFKAAMAAAVACGLIPVLEQTEQHADGATLAGFTFENNSYSVTGTSLGTTFTVASAPTRSASTTVSFSSISNAGALNSAGVLSYIGDVGTGTVLGMKTFVGVTNAQNFGFVSGNGSAKSLTAAGLLGSTFTYSFNIDNSSKIGIAFDAAGSSTGPRDFVLSYSTDGTNFSTFTTLMIGSGSTFTATLSTNATQTATSTTGAVTNFNSTAGNTIFSYSFTAPTALSDISTGVTGQLGYIRFSQTGAVGINGGVASSGGADRFDNVFITGSTVAIPEPAALSILSLASAAVALRRRRR